jgi:hypothetical protein
VAQQRHKIIHNRVALGGEESVSGDTSGKGPPDQPGEPTHRTYIIGDDGVVLCRKTPATVTDNEVIQVATARRCSVTVGVCRVIAM